MALTVDEEKNKIRSFIKKNRYLETMLGQITLQSEIGQGGNALVYSAVWGKSEVAVKLLAEDCAVEQSTRYQRFITEVREIIKLSDTKAVVPIYYVGELIVEESKYPYMVMKKYSKTLNSWIKDNNISDQGALMEVVKPLIHCLNTIHKNNIVHRDIKPQNILVDADGRFVLGDFGISWFDPEHYERLIKTGKHDRLANFAFSAPEQFERDPKPKPTMDLYALGQLIQWMVTGATTRGTGRPFLKEVSADLGVFDTIVEKLLQQNPANRPQSVRDLVELIKIGLESPKESYEDKILRITRGFDEIIKKAAPGKSGYTKIVDPIKIAFIMNLLAQSEDLELWWSQGDADCPINQKIRGLDEYTWIIDSGEHRIEELWVKKHYDLGNQFILLQCSPMDSFGIYENSSTNYEEAAWYKDRYITRGEYDDGVAEIDGEVVELGFEAELRTRELERDYLFIASKYNSINVDRSVVAMVYNDLRTVGNINEQMLKPLDKLRTHPDLQMLN